MQRPNILYLMLDQLAPQVLGAYGGEVCQTPTINALAEDGVVFENGYCNYPICAPARYGIMSGRLPSRMGALDNASEFPSEQPTFAHYLRHLGYHTCLAGKMHFIGADQLHGFEDRVTTDVYPSDFMWTTDWSLDPKVWEPWYHSMHSVKSAGPAPRSVNTEFDFETATEANRWLHDHAERDERPFFLAVSFISPHDPYVAPPAAWQRYEGLTIDDPIVGDIALEERDPHSARLHYTIGRSMMDVTRDEIRNMRRAYYAVMSWIDDRVASLLTTLDELGLRDNTIIALTADHGDMLGERGLFYKMSFFEYSSRVPMVIHAPQRFKPNRIRQNTSLIDFFPTFLEWANNGSLPALFSPLDGHSLNGLLEGDTRDWDNVVYSEYNAEGTQWPLLMVRRDGFKYIYGEEDPPQLYDLANDPHELRNLAGTAEHRGTQEALHREMLSTWDPPALRAEVLESQRRRLWLGKVLNTGKKTPWDWQPSRDATTQYFRSVEDGQQALQHGTLGH